MKNDEDHDQHDGEGETHNEGGVDYAAAEEEGDHDDVADVVGNDDIAVHDERL